jgi:protein SCO1/2
MLLAVRSHRLISRRSPRQGGILSARGAVLACALVAASAWPAAARVGAGGIDLGSGKAESTEQPAALRGVGIDQHLNEQVPLDLSFRDDAGETVKLGDYFGKKPVILALVYYECPMLCTLTLNGLVGALKAISFDPGKQFEVVVVSFNPEETPKLAAAKKASYLGRYGRPGTEQGWHFLTGDATSIHRLAEAVGFHYRYLPEQKQYAHATGITLLTPQGKVSRYFFGVDFSPRDLRLGLVEASNDKIGNPVDQVILYCYHYDPATGTYSAVAMNIVRLGGAVTVLLLGAFMVVFWRREHAGTPYRQG